jgi:hypothetical protein
VSGKLPVHRAVGVAHDLFASHAGKIAAPSPRDFLDAVRQFERIEFDVPMVGDTDGFLFYWGPANWFPEPTFVLGVIRQLEIEDSEGEHEVFIQVAMEFRYRPDSDLESLGSASSWWFRSYGTDFLTWLDSVHNAPVWLVVAGKPLREFEVSADEV